MAGLTPGSVIRGLGPWGPGLIDKYVNGRFSAHGETAWGRVFLHYTALGQPPGEPRGLPCVAQRSALLRALLAVPTPSAAHTNINAPHLCPSLIRTTRLLIRAPHTGQALTEAEKECFRSYFYHIAAGRGSGEYALRHLLAPGAWAHSPLQERLQELKVCVCVLLLWLWQGCRVVFWHLHAWHMYSCCSLQAVCLPYLVAAELQTQTGSCVHACKCVCLRRCP
jgi:hypothetical protein